MSKNLSVALAFGGDYDRIRPLQEGRVKIEGVDLKIDQMSSPHEVFHALAHGDHYDGGEMSLSFFSTITSKYGADSPFIGLPIYPSKMFRHGNILINTRSGIDHPRDLEGKVLGLPEYGMTMAVWIRSLLQDEYGVDIKKIRWREGRKPVALGDALHYPDDIAIETFSGGKPMLQMLSEGEWDAHIGVVPRVLPPNVRRLFPDYGMEERRYYEKTNIFPVMHVMVLRRTTHERHPELARALYQAACQARDLAVEELWSSTVLRASLPWLLPAVEEQSRVFKGDLWSYGIHANRAALTTYLESAWQQGLLWRRLSIEELFLKVE